MYLTRKYLVLPLAGCLALMAGGCDTFNSVMDKITGKERLPKEVVLPSDREHITPDQATKAYKPEDLAKGILRGDWLIEEVNGVPAVGETAPHIRFVPNEHKIYGDNGCNTMNAEYTYNPADSTISFSRLLTTMRLCNTPGLTDAEITSALANTHYYTWEEGESEFKVWFYDANRRPLMQIAHTNFQFLNGTWHVTAIGDLEVDDPDMKIVVDVDEGKLHGYTGCNIINGSMETDMNSANSISFQAFSKTMRACPNDNLETELLVALEETSTAKPLSADKVLLLNAHGQLVITMVRSNE